MELLQYQAAWRDEVVYLITSDFDYCSESNCSRVMKLLRLLRWTLSVVQPSRVGVHATGGRNRYTDVTGP